MRHEDNRGIICNLAERSRQIVDAVIADFASALELIESGVSWPERPLITEAREPKCMAFLFEPQCVVLINWNSDGLQRQACWSRTGATVLHVARFPPIMVAENGMDTKRCLKLCQNICPSAVGDTRGISAKAVADDVIAKKQDGIGTEAVRLLDDAVEPFD
jgi:hypothetical protein